VNSSFKKNPFECEVDKEVNNILDIELAGDSPDSEPVPNGRDCFETPSLAMTSEETPLRP